MGHQVVWPACSVTDPDSGEDVVLRKGDMLPDYVNEFTLFVLTTTGGVRFVEDPDPSLLAEENPPAQVLLPEHLPPPAGSDAEKVEIERAKVEGLPRARSGASTSAAKSTADADDADEDEDAPPAVSAAKPEWVEYAVRHRRKGQSEQDARTEAEATSKEQLVGRFGRR